MNVVKTHPFEVRTAPKANRPGTWNSTVVEILMDGVKIGEYERNYPAHAETTFAPFKVGARWFALYSPYYTGTRIMSLPDCRDIGGEERNANGFCPAELYVPCYRLSTFDMRFERRNGETVEPYVEPVSVTLWPWEAADIAEAEADAARSRTNPVTVADAPQHGGFNHAVSDWRWCPFGFVAGCHWGDDGSWKIQHLDLARAAEGVLVRDARFGYVQMPARMSLMEAVDLSVWEPGLRRIGISQTRWYDVAPDGAKEL